MWNENQIETYWNYLWKNFFYEMTSLFYDYSSSREFRRRFDHLPSPEEIAASFPNPCGWGTGMEDCVLNAGSILDILSIRKERDGEKNSELAVKILKGIHQCTFSHGNPGFVVRGISPRDGKSCYPNSSRDQFTLGVFGAWRFAEHYSKRPERELAVEILTAIAEFCKKRITPENQWDLGALDGGPAIVSQMWECGIHEVLRLPMFFATAFRVTDDVRWKTEAEKYFLPGLEISERFDPEESWWDIPLVQMQLSLETIRDTGVFPEWNPRIQALMERLGLAAEKGIDRLLEEARRYHGDWCPIRPDWHFRKFRPHPLIAGDSGRILFRNRPFLSGDPDPSYSTTNEILRGLGNYTIAREYSGLPLGTETEKRRNEFLTEIDFTDSCSGNLVQLLHAAHLTRKRRNPEYETL